MQSKLPALLYSASKVDDDDVEKQQISVKLWALQYFYEVRK